ncbi:hypothetical protein BY458DRAFT_519429 [Sporodiniella umbellata]|nr:hypothetical protein BY458DRAFT_519429 [Sporodiniella umbellata]
MSNLNMDQDKKFLSANSQDVSDEESQRSVATKSPDQKNAVPQTFKEKMIASFVMFRPLFIMLIIDVGLPLAIFYILKMYISILIALILSGIPPLLHVIYTFIKRRKLDVLGCIFVVSYTVSAVLSLITGDVRLTLLRDSTVTALISVMFFVTLIPLKTRWFEVLPMVYLISQQMFAKLEPITWVDAEGKERTRPVMEFCWEHVRVFRRYFYIITAAWSVLLMGEFVAKVVMIQSTLSVDQVVLYGNIIIIIVVVVMTTATMLYSHRMRKSTRADIEEWMKVNDYRDRLTQ